MSDAQPRPGWTTNDLKRGIEDGLKDLDQGRYLEFDEPGLRRFVEEMKRALDARWVGRRDPSSE